MSTSDIINRVTAYCAQHGITETTFGRKAVNDGKLIPRLRSGRSITLRTLELIEAQLSAPPDQEAEARAAERGAA
jgi:hypothetical protein